MNIEVLLSTTFDTANNNFQINVRSNKKPLFYVVKVVGHFNGKALFGPKIDTYFANESIIIPNKYISKSGDFYGKNQVDIVFNKYKGISSNKRVLSANYDTMNQVNISLTNSEFDVFNDDTYQYKGTGQFKITECYSIYS